MDTAFISVTDIVMKGTGDSYLYHVELEREWKREEKRERRERVWLHWTSFMKFWIHSHTQWWKVSSTDRFLLGKALWKLRTWIVRESRLRKTCISCLSLGGSGTGFLHFTPLQSSMVDERESLFWVSIIWQGNGWKYILQSHSGIFISAQMSIKALCEARVRWIKFVNNYGPGDASPSWGWL